MVAIRVHLYEARVKASLRRGGERRGELPKPKTQA